MATRMEEKGWLAAPRGAHTRRVGDRSVRGRVLIVVMMGHGVRPECRFGHCPTPHWNRVGLTGKLEANAPRATGHSGERDMLSTRAPVLSNRNSGISTIMMSLEK